MLRSFWTYIGLPPEPQRICRHCEYWDCGARERMSSATTIGDCHNRNSPRFNPPADFGCDEWAPHSTLLAHVYRLVKLDLITHDRNA